MIQNKHTIISLNFHFHIAYGNLFIINMADVPKRCTKCQYYDAINLYGKPSWVSSKWHSTTLCNKWQIHPNIYATYDGVNKVPFAAYDLELLNFAIMRHYDVPNFGTLLLVSLDRYREYYVMLYNPLKKISQVINGLTYDGLYMDDDKVLIGCITTLDEYILVNTDGEILDMITVRSKIDDDNLLFNTPYGQLIGAVNKRELYPEAFMFISASKGSNTKPAIRPVDD
jgi:hypothetical protein